MGQADERKDEFMGALAALGGSAENGHLRSILEWDEDTYEAVRSELVNTGLVSPGRGRGGSAALNDGQTTIPRFLLYFMKSRPARSRLTSAEGGTSINRINQAKLAALPVFPPLLKKQEEIVIHLDAFSEESKHLASIYERKLAALEELKTSLLHQAFNSEL